MKKINKDKQIRVRCWVDIDGEKFFGPGRVKLLKLIEETGSIAKASRRMGMSYKKAWVMIDDMNSKVSDPFVIAKKGGQKGGGTELTEPGRKVVKAFDRLSQKIDSIIGKEKELLELIG